MKILLFGSSGTIGKAIAENLTSAGHEVIGISRKTDPGVDIGKPEELKAYLEGMEPVDHIICTGGGVHFGGPLHTLTDDEIYNGIHSKLMGQVNIVRFGYFKINKGGSILLTGGMLAYKYMFPNASQVAMVNSALNGFVVSAGGDCQDLRINVLHPPLIAESAALFGLPPDGCPTAAEGAKVYAKCLFDETGTGQEYTFPGFDK